MVKSLPPICNIIKPKSLSRATAVSENYRAGNLKKIQTINTFKDLSFFFKRGALVLPNDQFERRMDSVHHFILSNSSSEAPNIERNILTTCMPENTKSQDARSRKVHTQHNQDSYTSSRSSSLSSVPPNLLRIERARTQLKSTPKFRPEIQI